MSVFAAVIDFESVPAETAANALLNGLPDQYFEPAACKTVGPVSIAVKAHRITPESLYEVQPCFREGVLMCADCRLDNRSELLVLFNCINFREVGEIDDIELIFRAYKKWGANLAQYLRGDFSIVIYDTAVDAVFAFVDHFSVRKLFYRKIGSRIFLSNQLVRVRRGVDQPVTLSEQWAANFVVRSGCLMLCPRDITLFNEIKQLAWGQKMTLSASGLSIESFVNHGDIEELKWNPALFRDLVHEAQRLFLQAVSRRLRFRQSTVYSHLSGGFDSSSTTVCALQMIENGKDLTGLHYRPSGCIDNLHMQRRVLHEDERISAIKAMYPKLNMEYFSGSGWSLHQCLEHNLTFADMPLGNAGNHRWLNEMADFIARRGGQVILSGAAGNFTLSLRNSMMISTLYEDIKVWKALRFGSQMKEASCRSSLLNKQGCSNLYSRQRFTRNHMRVRTLNAFMSAKGLDLEALFKNAFGVEHWTPVADYDFARFVWSLPREFFVYKRDNQRLVKMMMSSLLPERVMDQRLRGVQSPDTFDRLFDEICLIKDRYSHNDPSHPVCWNRKYLLDTFNRPKSDFKNGEGLLAGAFACYNTERLLEHVGSW